MSLLSKIFGKNNPEKKVEKAALIEAQVCPNCWGKMEYDDQFVDFVKDQTKSNVNNDKTNQKAFIQQFVETNVSGIHLKRDGNKHSCPRCNSIF